MIEITEAYKQVSEEKERNSYIEWEFGGWNTIITELMQKGLIETNGAKKFSTPRRLVQEIEETEEYITCEPNAHKLSDSLFFLKNEVNDNQPVAYWSEELSSSTKTFDTNPYISMSYYGTRYTKLSNIMLKFEEICSDFSISWYETDKEVYQYEMKNNKELNCYITIPEKYKTQVFNHIIIKFKKTYDPYRYIKLKNISFGNKQYFSSEDVLSFEIIEETSYNTSERFHNSLSLSLNNKDKKWDIFNPKNKITEISKMQEISGYHYLKVGKQYKKIPLGKFYVDEVKNYENKLELNAYDKSYFMTSIYYGSLFYENETVYKVFEDFFNYYNYISYEIDEKLKERYISGYVETNEFNEALRSIAEACGCIIKNNRYGKIEIKLANDYIKYNLKGETTLYNKTTKTYKQHIINNASNSNNVYDNYNINIYHYSPKNGDTSKRSELYNAEHTTIGTYIIQFQNKPIKDTTIGLKVYNTNNVVMQEIKEDGTSVGNNNIVNSLKKYATSCIINVNQIIGEKIKIVITGLELETEYYTSVYSESEETSVIENKLITNYAINIGEWMNNRREIKYNFSTLLAPYVEVGDLCKYRTEYKEEKEFIPTKITISNSMQETIEGE